MRLKQPSFICAILLAVFLIGCGHQPQKYMIDGKEAAPAETGTQMANPATQKCLETAGASWTAKENEEGQYGVCTFPDQSWCEEWAYFRGECVPGNNMSLCEGKFWGKSVCPTLYEPVCATLVETDPLTNKTYETGKETFANACIACINVDPSKPNVKTKGYVAGRCD